MLHDQFATFILRCVQDELFGEPIDQLFFRTDQNVAQIRDWAFKAKWNRFYDLVQFMADFSKNSEGGYPYDHARETAYLFISKANEILEAEKAAYRFVGGELSLITDEVEIASIEDGLSVGDAFGSSRAHLENGLKLYSNRDKPDYRNSIKEAISAIEAAFSSVNEERSNNMVKAVEKAEGRGLLLHPALKKGILNIYGWTSDEAGVRHALHDGDAKVGEAEAKLMLVLCSALLHFIAIKSLELGGSGRALTHMQ